jgi:uncharacterized protein YunC (DUF1805 family)
MDVEDYRIKYLKYKQKYTNALQNMQGGALQNISDALTTQPSAIFVVDEDTCNKLKKSCKINSNVGIVDLPNQFNVESIKKAIAMVNPNAIRILPMREFIKRQEKSRIFRMGSNLTVFKDGIEKVDGKEAKSGNLSFTAFGFNPSEKNKYQPVKAIEQLTQQTTQNYLTIECKLQNPNILILNGRNFHFCGALNDAIVQAVQEATAAATAEAKIKAEIAAAAAKNS